MATKRKQWMQFHIEDDGTYDLYFRHGRRSWCALSTSPFSEDARIEVVRGGQVFDQGKMACVKVYDEDLETNVELFHFSGLDKIMSGRTERPRHTRHGDFIIYLFPEWFEDGDVIRVEYPSLKFRAWERAVQTGGELK